MLKVTIELPETVDFFTRDDHKLASLDFADMDKRGKLVPFLSGRDGAVVKALRIPAMNAYNSGGSEATKAEKLAALNKRLDAWGNGDWAIVERGESQYSAMRDLWIDDFRESNPGRSVRDAEKFIRDSVTETFGKDTKATFQNMLEVIAKSLVDNGDFESTVDARAAVESSYQDRIDEANAKRDKAESKVSMPTLDLSKFKKPAKAK